MKAAQFTAFGQPLRITELRDLTPRADSVIVRVAACGICRSDWHAWMGHDDGVELPHVPGHELSGQVFAVGEDVRHWQVGARVTTPFCCGCGVCRECSRGAAQICLQQTQPGFTHWGAFAELVEVRHADHNLVAIPESVDYVTAASLGCRFATSFRALVAQAKLRGGEWIAVHGCGGVGLSAIMIARALGANVIAIDVAHSRLHTAKRLGADSCVDAHSSDVVNSIMEITSGGAQVSIDALGSHQTCWNSVECLAPSGRHIQIGLMLGKHAAPKIPMGTVIAKELELYGSHGMAAHDYPQLLQMIERGQLRPEKLISDVVDLETGANLLERMNDYPTEGISVISFE